jgi:hypothetical protein
MVKRGLSEDGTYSCMSKVPEYLMVTLSEIIFEPSSIAISTTNQIVTNDGIIAHYTAQFQALTGPG